MPFQKGRSDHIDARMSEFGKAPPSGPRPTRVIIEPLHMPGDKKELPIVVFHFLVEEEWHSYWWTADQAEELFSKVPEVAEMARTAAAEFRRE